MAIEGCFFYYNHHQNYKKTGLWGFWGFLTLYSLHFCIFEALHNKRLRINTASRGSSLDSSNMYTRPTVCSVFTCISCNPHNTISPFSWCFRWTEWLVLAVRGTVGNSHSVLLTLSTVLIVLYQCSSHLRKQKNHLESLLKMQIPGLPPKYLWARGFGVGLRNLCF